MKINIFAGRPNQYYGYKRRTAHVSSKTSKMKLSKDEQYLSESVTTYLWLSCYEESHVQQYRYILKKNVKQRVQIDQMSPKSLQKAFGNKFTVVSLVIYINHRKENQHIWITGDLSTLEKISLRDLAVWVDGAAAHNKSFF